VTKIYLVSPPEPSGASWMINCFLELGIKVSHKPVVDTVWRHAGSAAPGYMWQRAADGTARLHPRANILKKFLPILSRVDAFRFREDVEVEYLQDFPAFDHAGQRVLFFVRDPRDSLYSAYRRQQPDFDYGTFLRWPDADTLLDRPAHWRLFVESWTQHARACFTFEEYKRDAAGLLRTVLTHVPGEYTLEDIDRAVQESTFEKARAAEERYRAMFADDHELINRAGRVESWGDQSESRDEAAAIESTTGNILRTLGYACTASTHSVPDVRPSIDALFRFCENLDEVSLRASKLPNHRICRLLDNLASISDREGWTSTPRLMALRQRFVEGSEHQFAQMRDLLRRQRLTPGPRPNGPA
jgi:hypothetical protein